MGETHFRGAPSIVRPSPRHNLGDQEHLAFSKDTSLISTGQTIGSRELKLRRRELFGRVGIATGSLGPEDSPLGFKAAGLSSPLVVAHQGVSIKPRTVA